MHTLFLAPCGFGGGLNSISLGLIRALERAGLTVGFFKPIAQPFPLDQGRERSCVLVERTLSITSPEPLPLEQVERQLADGELDLLLEDVVSRYQEVAAGKDVVIVEGLQKVQPGAPVKPVPWKPAANGNASAPVASASATASASASAAPANQK